MAHKPRRQAGKTSKIKITEEMISAATGELLAYDSRVENERTAVLRIVRAFLACGGIVIVFD